MCPEELVNEVDIIDITRQTPPERSNPVSRPQLTQYYKTEDNRYVYSLVIVHVGSLSEV